MPVAPGSPYSTTQGPTPPAGNANTPANWAAKNTASQATTNPQGFYQSIEADLSNPSFLSKIAGNLLGGAAPGMAGAGLTEAQALESLGVSGAGLAVNEQNQSLANAGQYANALLSEEGIGIQGQELGSQEQTQAQQQAIEQGQYGLSQQGIEQQLAQLKAQYPQELQNQLGSAAASGASNSIGNRVATGQLEAFNGPGGFQEQSLFRQQQLAQLGQESEQVGYAGQQAQNKFGQQQLALSAKQAGLPVAQMTSQLGFGLQQLGIQADPAQFLGQAGNALGTQAGDLGAVVSQASVIGGLGPNAINYGQ